MSIQILLTAAFILGVPLIAFLIWLNNRTSDDTVDVPHKWDA